MPVLKSTFLVFLLTCIQYSVFGLTDKYRCMWHDDPARSIVIGWNQISGSSASVFYDISDGGTDVNQYAYSKRTGHTVKAKGMNNHFVRLDELMPNTIYYFLIVDSDGASKPMSFKTAPDSPYERLSIIAGGDSRNHRTARKQANKMVSKLRPHCVLFGGDMTGGDNAAQWKNWFNDWQYTIGSDGRMTPIIVARGNHEYSNKTLIDLFNVPYKGLYYGITFGGSLLRVYTLNTLISSGGEQRDWLYHDLETNKDITWKTAQYHYAIRPHTKKKSERNDQLQDWATLFYKYQVQLVVESDIHVVKTTYPIRPSKEALSDEGFIRDDKYGTVYVGEGCWGAPLRRNDDDKTWTRNSGSFNQFKWIFVSEDRIEVRTVKTDNADAVAEVNHTDIFTPPTGIDIWNPSNGPVITIYNDGRTDAPVLSEPVATTKKESTKKKKTTPKKKKANIFTPPVIQKLEVLDVVVDAVSDKAAISWMTKNETSDMTYEILRSIDGVTYRTVAEVKSQGAGKEQVYKVQDTVPPNTDPNGIFYRLKIKSTTDSPRMFNVRWRQKKALVWMQYPKITPDEVTNLLKIKYAINTPADVHVSMVNTLQRIVYRTDYPNQKSGNYLKSIDMRSMNSGTYLLIIKADKEVIARYQVVKENS